LDFVKTTPPPTKVGLDKSNQKNNSKVGPSSGPDGGKSKATTKEIEECSIRSWACCRMSTGPIGGERMDGRVVLYTMAGDPAKSDDDEMEDIRV